MQKGGQVPEVMRETDLETVHAQALRAAGVASEIKAEDIRVLDMHDLVSYVDYLVVCTGRSSRQTRRIADEISLRLKNDTGLRLTRREGDRGGKWILLDYLDFMVHVFTPEARDFYRLDTLWKEAPSEVIE